MGRARGTFGWAVATMVGAAALACGLTLILDLPVRIRDDAFLLHPTGTWATLADDFAHGILYRPVHSDLGYGGTRYFPLYFVAQGTLAALGVRLLEAGQAVSLASGLALAVATYVLLRREGLVRALAAAVAIVALGGRATFLGLGSVRGDVLPVALAVWGLAVAPRLDGRGSPSAAGVLFGLALLAKPTCLWAPVAAMVSLVASGQPGRAGALGLVTSSVTGLGLAMVWLLSDGRLTESLSATAGGVAGGEPFLNPVTALAAQIRLSDGILIGCALGALALGGLARHCRLAWSLPIALAVTLVVFTSPGVVFNHLVDVEVLATLTLGAALRAKGGPAFLAALGICVGGSLSAIEVHEFRGWIAEGRLREVAAALPDGDGPILSEQPWLPLLRGERPYLLDAFALRLTTAADPAVRRDLLARLDERWFRAVVLIHDPVDWREWYEHVAFGPGFAEHLAAGYVLSRRESLGPRAEVYVFVRRRE